MISKSKEKTIVKKLYENRKVDSIIGRTQFGINKTDLKVYIKSKDMFVNNCSTGEQKITMVAVIFLFIMFLFFDCKKNLSSRKKKYF